MSAQLFNQITANTYTTHQLSKRLNLLKRYINDHFYNKGQKKPDYLTSEDITWLNSLGDSFFKHFSLNHLNTTFEELEAEVKKLKVLLLYIPYELPEQETARLAEYVKRSYGEDFILDIKLDPSLLAGCALVWNGIYKDYSLRKKIEENRQKILEELRGWINK